MNTDQLKEKAHQWRGKAEDLARRAKDALGGAGNTASEDAKSAIDRARGAAKDARSTAGEKLDQGKSASARGAADANEKLGFDASGDTGPEKGIY